jgi:hypothetical protein
MMRHPVTYFALGVASVWAYHKFVKPLPGGKMA